MGTKKGGASSSGGQKKVGSNRLRCKRYREAARLEQRRLRRIVVSSGPKAARRWADSKGIFGYSGVLDALARTRRGRHAARYARGAAYRRRLARRAYEREVAAAVASRGE